MLKKQDYHEKLNGHPIWAFLLPKIVICIFVLILCFCGYRTTKGIRDMQDKINQIDGTFVKYPCRITFSVIYDKEPVDLQLIDPDGKIYDKNNEFVTTNDDGTQIAISLITEETGDWKIAYNRKRNKHLEPTLALTHVDKLFITDVQIVDGIDHITAIFIPQFGNGTNKDKYRCTVTMSSKSTGQILPDTSQEVIANETAALQINTEHMNTADDWKLTIQVYDEQNMSDPDRNAKYEYASEISYHKPGE